MYIRRTRTNNSSTGERYYTYRLVASQRVEGKPRQMTLLNPGRHFAVDQDLWASLCVRIEQLLSRPYDLKVAIYARKAEALGRLEDWSAVIATCAEGIKLTETYRYKAIGQYLQSAYLRSRIRLYSLGVKAAYERHDYALMLEWAELSKCRSVLRYHQQRHAPAGALEQTEQEFLWVCQQIDTARVQKEGSVPVELLKKRRTLWDLLLIQRAQSRSVAPIPEFSLEAVKSVLADDEAVLSLRDRSRVVPRSDRACVFTERSIVKMQALRNRVESFA
jgi:hypothetical protein